MERKHKEAFCLMTYQCEECGKKETLWNSRDGVTPFIIGCSKCRGKSQHVNFHGDRYAPDHFPVPGQRIFVDLTEDRHLVYLRARVRQLWEANVHGCQERYETSGEMLAALSETKMSPGEPDIMVIQSSEKCEVMNGSEAVYGFCGWLTTRKEPTTMSSKHDSAPIATLAKEFVGTNNLGEPRANWTDRLVHPVES